MANGPISNMVLLLENQGADCGTRPTRRGHPGRACHSSLLRTGGPYIVIGIDKGSPARWRFDAAHELGHVLLHAKVRRETLDRPEQHKKIEEQAHRFARAFLLPLASFGDDLFGVSLTRSAP